MTHRIVTGIACVILIVSTYQIIELVRVETMEPLDEITVQVRKPMTMVEILISNCPNKLGHLQVFLDCMDKIVYKYR